MQGIITPTRLLTKTALIALLVGFSSISEAGKLYKWVDKEGNTHYTQTPPPESEADKVIVKQASSGASIPVQRKGDYDYCGKTRLPGPHDDAKAILKGLSDQEESWQNSLRSKEQSLNDAIKAESKYWDSQLKSRYSSSSSNYNRDRQESLVTEIETLRCALNWAGEKRNTFRTQSREFAGDYKAAEHSYQAALDDAIQACGYKPKNYDDRYFEDHMTQWNRCMRKHNSELSRKKRDMQEQKRVYDQAR